MEERRTRGGTVYLDIFRAVPDYPLDRGTPGRLVPFLRRSPDPSLQLVRLDVLDEARGGREGKFLFDGSAAAWEEVLRRLKNPPLAERIAADNLATLEREGADAFERVYAALREERARAYAPFSLAAPGSDLGEVGR